MKTITRAELVELQKAGTPASEVSMRKQFIADSVDKVMGMGDRVRRFVISTAAVDRDNDTISAAGWQLDNYRKNPVVLWAHDYSCLPVGKAIQVGVENDQLVATAEFADHDFANTVLRLLDGGFLKATSVGFRPITYAMNEERRGYDFQTQELLEFSVVPVPANAEALALAGLDAADVAQLKSWAEGVSKALATKTDEPEPTPEPEPVPDPTPEPVTAITAAALIDAIKDHLKTPTVECAVCAAAAEVKQGRVLSRANEGRVRQAADLIEQGKALLSGVLAQLAATDDEDDPDDDEDDEKWFALDPDPAPVVVTAAVDDDADVITLDASTDDDLPFDENDMKDIVRQVVADTVGQIVRDTTATTLARMRGRVD